MTWILYSNQHDAYQGRGEIKTVYLTRAAVREFLGEHHAFQRHLKPYPHYHARLQLAPDVAVSYLLAPQMVESGYLAWAVAMERRFPRSGDIL